MKESLQPKEHIAPLIRPLTFDDIDQVYEMGKGTLEFKVSNDSSFWEKEELERWVAENTDDVLLIAETNAQISGFLLSKYHKPTRVGNIVDIYTKEQFRHQGIASALENEAIRQLKAKGATYIYALAQSDNNASIRLQESIGMSKGQTMIWMELTSEK